MQYIFKHFTGYFLMKYDMEKFHSLCKSAENALAFDTYQEAEEIHKDINGSFEIQRYIDV